MGSVVSRRKRGIFAISVSKPTHKKLFFFLIFSNSSFEVMINYFMSPSLPLPQKEEIKGAIFYKNNSHQINLSLWEGLEIGIPYISLSFSLSAFSSTISLSIMG
jgi:hypothetical protein